MFNFGQIKYNVGTRVGDTSTSFSTIIGTYINQRYREVFERYNWDIVNPSYNFPTVIGQNTYLLPSNFGKELYVYNATMLFDLVNNSLQDLEQMYPQNLADKDSSIKYGIYTSQDTNTPPNPIKNIVLYPNPSGIYTIQMPYLIAQSNMVNPTDIPIIDCDYEVELGATADAWRTKRQFAKASDFERQFEEHIIHRIWNQENQPNRVVQFHPNIYPVNQLY